MNHNQSNKPTSTTPPRHSLSILERIRQAYKLWCEIRKKLPKDYRYTLGLKIDEAFIDLLKSVLQASSVPALRKLPHAERALGLCDLLKFLLQVAWEIGILENKKYASLSEPLNDIGRMLGGWNKNLLLKTQTPQIKRG